MLLVEAGGTDRTPIITMPGVLPFAYQSKRIQWGYGSGPEPHLEQRVIDEKLGKVIGGSSSINAMIYNRGNPMDLEGWANEEGLPGWDYAHCLPYFRRMDTFVDGPDDWRGGDGPVHISRSKADHKSYHSFLRAREQAGFEITPDHNGFKQEGLHVAQVFIHKGVRWSAARAYLRPALKRGNLALMTKAIVKRVTVENGAAVGIEVVDGASTRLIRCAREVVLCAGAINSPKLLMLSGIGDPDKLRTQDFEVTAEAREVGRNLQNHPGVDIQYVANRGDSLVSELDAIGRVKLTADWVLRKRGLGTTNFFETGAFLRTRDDVDYPNMQFEFLPLTR